MRRVKLKLVTIEDGGRIRRKADLPMTLVNPEVVELDGLDQFLLAQQIAEGLFDHAGNAVALRLRGTLSRRKATIKRKLMRDLGRFAKVRGFKTQCVQHGSEFVFSFKKAA
jgi:hypothetical protein